MYITWQTIITAGLWYRIRYKKQRRNVVCLKSQLTPAIIRKQPGNVA